MSIVMLVVLIVFSPMAPGLVLQEVKGCVLIFKQFTFLAKTRLLTTIEWVSVMGAQEVRVGAVVSQASAPALASIEPLLSR